MKYPDQSDAMIHFIDEAPDYLSATKALTLKLQVQGFQKQQYVPRNPAEKVLKKVGNCKKEATSELPKKD